MKQSTNMTYTVPGPWPVKKGVVVVRAPQDSPVRAEVRNLGGGTVALAYDQNDLISIDGPSAKTYRLPSGEVTIFVLAKNQKMFAIGDGVGIMVSVAMSEAFPTEKLAL